MKGKSIVAVFAVIMIIGVGAISQASLVFAISSEDTKAEISYVQQIDNIKVGETAKIKVTVKNTGTTIFHSKVRAYLYVDGQYIRSKSLNGLKPGQKKTVELEYTPTKSGSFNYYTKVKEKLGDTKVTLAKSSIYSFVVEYGETKAKITYVQQINNIKVGETAKIKVTVKNTGTTTFHSKVNAFLYVDGHYICSKSLEGLKPGQTGTVELEYTPTEVGTPEYRSRVKEKVGGTKVVLATSNTYSFVAESGDTKAEITYVQQIDNIKVGETAKIKVTVKNTGTTTFRKVRAYLYVDGHYICSKSLEGLKPGQTGTVELEYTPTEAGTPEYRSRVKEKVGGTKVVLATSNTYYLVAEEGNEFYHGSKIDAEIYKLYELPSGRYEKGDYVQVHYRVKNTGEENNRFYFGYSVKDELNGKWWDAPYKSETIKSDSSCRVRLKWKVPNDAPRGRYDVHIAVWERESGGYLYDELDRKTYDKQFSVADREWIGQADVWFCELVDSGVARVIITDGNTQHLYDNACWYANQIIDKAKEKGYTVVKSQTNMAYEIRAHVAGYLGGERDHSNPIDIELYTGNWCNFWNIPWEVIEVPCI